MDPYKALKDTGAVPIVFCDEKKKWLPIEGHMDCDYCAGTVLNEDDDPVSFICTRRGEKREMGPEDDRPCEDGRGAPADPDAYK